MFSNRYGWQTGPANCMSCNLAGAFTDEDVGLRHSGHLVTGMKRRDGRDGRRSCGVASCSMRYTGPRADRAGQGRRPAVPSRRSLCASVRPSVRPMVLVSRRFAVIITSRCTPGRACNFHQVVPRTRRTAPAECLSTSSPIDAPARLHGRHAAVKVQHPH